MDIRSFLALGSNLGDRIGYLQEAVATLHSTEGIRVCGTSSVYETEPLGPSDDPYLNAIVEVAVQCSPRELLKVAQQCEHQAGRVRTVRWGARTLDVDIIWMDGVECSEPDLIVPHPEAGNRLFVLIPLQERAPDIARKLARIPIPSLYELPASIVPTNYSLAVEEGE